MDTRYSCPVRLPVESASEVEKKGQRTFNASPADDGVLLACGWNKDGQLGIVSDSGPDCVEPGRVDLAGRVRHVACGWNHTVVCLGKQRWQRKHGVQACCQCPEGRHRLISLARLYIFTPPGVLLFYDTYVDVLLHTRACTI